MAKAFVGMQEFLKNFVSKERRDRIEFQLNHAEKRNQFLQKLNHGWADVLDTRKLRSLPDVANDFEYVKKELEMTDHDKCYVISNYDDIDNCILEFETAFLKSYGRGFATLLINLRGDRLYLETEEMGRQHRFVGIAS